MDSLLYEPSIHTVKAILILDNNGERLIAQYYNDLQHPTYKEQRTFEEKVFSKTAKQDAEILLLEGLTIVYRSSVDIILYVLASVSENELMLMGVLNTLFDGLSLTLKRSVEKKSIIANLNLVLLILEELCDKGVILESDPNLLSQRVGPVKQEETSYNQIISEHSLNNVLQTAKETLKWGILKN